MSNKYEIDALAKAREDNLKAVDIDKLDYRAIAALAGVTIEANGNSPLDFFYTNVSNHVINALKVKEEESKEAEESVAMAAALSKLTVFERDLIEKKIAINAISSEIS